MFDTCLTNRQLMQAVCHLPHHSLFLSPAWVIVPPPSSSCRQADASVLLKAASPAHPQRWQCFGAETGYTSYLSWYYVSAGAKPYISCLTTELASPAWLMVVLSSFSSVRGCVVTRR